MCERQALRRRETYPWSRESREHLRINLAMLGCEAITEDGSKALMVGGHFSCEAFDLRRAKKPADISSQSGMLPPVGVDLSETINGQSTLVERRNLRGRRVRCR